MTTIKDQHLKWSDTQSEILSARGSASSHWKAGVDFSEAELPHHYLMASNNSTELYQEFENWMKNNNRNKKSSRLKSPIVGAWRRRLFTCSPYDSSLEFKSQKFPVNTKLHTTESMEETFNLQSNSLFIDIRIPRSREKLFKSGEFVDLQLLDDEMLQCFARQHAFAGYSFMKLEEYPYHHDTSTITKKWSCTRHHSIDWNFVPNRSIPRAVPNKWWVEPLGSGASLKNDFWRENSYKKVDQRDGDEDFYYYEVWERLEGDEGAIVVLKLVDSDRDGILIVIGDHFNYIYARKDLFDDSPEISKGGTVHLVDDAILMRSNKYEATSYITIEAGHGKISNGWKIDNSTQPGAEGKSFFDGLSSDFDIRRQNRTKCNDEKLSIEYRQYGQKEVVKWAVFESSFASLEELKAFFTMTLSAALTKTKVYTIESKL